MDQAWEAVMRSFISAVVIAIVLALGAAYVLDRIQVPAQQAFSTTGVRI